jgi:tetratricopeptide (TPR) repeat protein
MFILRKLGKKDEAVSVFNAIKSIDPLDYWSEFEKSMAGNGDMSFFAATRARRSEGMIAIQELLEVVCNYIAVGAREEALAVIDEALKTGEPFSGSQMVHMYRASLLDDESAAKAEVALASGFTSEGNHPLRIEEVNMFEHLAALCPDNASVHYLYGNLLYYIGQKDNGLAEWYRAAELDPSFALANRNVGFGEGQNGNYETAVKYYDLAIKNNPGDPLLYAESDKLCEKANMPAKQRQARLEAGIKTVMKYDDAVIRLLMVYNETGNWDKAIKIMNTRHFHLWEGGGDIHDVYVTSHILKGKSLLEKKSYKKAMEEFRLATLYPDNLEVPAPAQSVTFEDVIAEMRQELTDNYAKFGNEDTASKAKNLDELEKLLKEIKLK